MKIRSSFVPVQSVAEKLVSDASAAKKVPTTPVEAVKTTVTANGQVSDYVEISQGIPFTQPKSTQPVAKAQPDANAQMDLGVTYNKLGEIVNKMAQQTSQMVNIMEKLNVNQPVNQAQVQAQTTSTTLDITA